jgi:hypothetical protein
MEMLISDFMQWTKPQSNHRSDCGIAVDIPLLRTFFKLLDEEASKIALQEAATASKASNGEELLH